MIGLLLILVGGLLLILVGGLLLVLLFALIGLLPVLLFALIGLLLILVGGLLLVLPIFLLLPVMGVLRLLARLFHKLLQLLDPLFQLFCLFPVGKKELLVADDRRVAGTGPHAFAVKVLGTVQLGKGLFDAFFGGIEVLSLKLFHGLLQAGAGVEVGDDAEILVGRSAHKGFLLGGRDGAFI